MNHTAINSIADYSFPQKVSVGNGTIMSPSIGKLAEALAKAQAKMKPAIKDASNPFFKSQYADLNSVIEACYPSLNAEGISVTQPIVQKDGADYVRTMFIHSSGEYIGSDTKIIFAKQNDAQSQGSGITYARRYGLQALAGLGAADDDGNAAVGNAGPKTKTVMQKRPITHSDSEGF
jgi:hypothetical protein